MANKKYNEFPPGTYDPAKIFLQADPVTGALEKVNLPATNPAKILTLQLNSFSAGVVSFYEFRNDFGPILSITYSMANVITVKFTANQTYPQDSLAPIVAFPFFQALGCLVGIAEDDEINFSFRDASFDKQIPAATPLLITFPFYNSL